MLTNLRRCLEHSRGSVMAILEDRQDYDVRLAASKLDQHLTRLDTAMAIILSEIFLKIGNGNLKTKYVTLENAAGDGGVSIWVYVARNIPEVLDYQRYVNLISRTHQLLIDNIRFKECSETQTLAINIPWTEIYLQILDEVKPASKAAET